MKKIFLLIITFLTIFACASSGGENKVTSTLIPDIDKQPFYVQVAAKSWKIGFTAGKESACDDLFKTLVAGIDSDGKMTLKEIQGMLWLAKFARESCRLGVNDYLTGQNHLGVLIQKLKEKEE